MSISSPINVSIFSNIFKKKRGNQKHPDTLASIIEKIQDTDSYLYELTKTLEAVTKEILSLRDEIENFEKNYMKRIGVVEENVIAATKNRVDSFLDDISKTINSISQEKFYLRNENSILMKKLEDDIRHTNEVLTDSLKIEIDRKINEKTRSYDDEWTRIKDDTRNRTSTLLEELNVKVNQTLQNYINQSLENYTASTNASIAKISEEVVKQKEIIKKLVEGLSEKWLKE